MGQREGARGQGWGRFVVVRPGVGGDGGFVGGEEVSQGGDSSVTERDARWGPKGEGGMKVAREGGDEGCVAVMLHEVRLIVAKEDRGDGGKIVMALGKLRDW